MGESPASSIADLAVRVAETVAHVRARVELVPQVGLTLGSGLGGVAAALENAVSLPTSTLPHWPRSTVPGHEGRLVVGRWAGVPMVALAGRSHRYEGYTLDRVTFGVRVMMELGARTMLFTNAVGGLSPHLEPGDLMLATDHVNFIGKRGLLSPSETVERRSGRRVASYYDPRLRESLCAAALRAGVRVRLGVLIGGHGPSYETAAEVRMAAALGADAACMSTVHEVTLAAELGCRVASLSCVTNLATGISDRPLTHEEVTVVADRVAGRLRRILDEYLAVEERCGT